VLDVAELLTAAERIANGGSALDRQVVSSVLDRAMANDRLATLTDSRSPV
jgi:hypothetical protein